MREINVFCWYGLLEYVPTQVQPTDSFQSFSRLPRWTVLLQSECCLSRLSQLSPTHIWAPPWTTDSVHYLRVITIVTEISSAHFLFDFFWTFSFEWITNLLLFFCVWCSWLTQIFKLTMCAKQFSGRICSCILVKLVSKCRPYAGNVLQFFIHWFDSNMPNEYLIVVIIIIVTAFFFLNYCFIVALQSEPKFVQELRDVRAVQFEEVIFECKFCGNPTPGRQWEILQEYIFWSCLWFVCFSPPCRIKHHFIYKIVQKWVLILSGWM